MKKDEKPRFVRRRRHLWKSGRKLSAADLAVLEFLWTWKVASTPMLKIAAFPGKSPWWVYKALRQLEEERFIQALPRSKLLEIEPWALTDRGSEVVLMGRDDLSQYRFKVHSPAHDYLATCLQLGEQDYSFRADRKFYTEQMLSSLKPMNFPPEFRKIDSHIPDGVTEYRGVKRAIVGYEVDLNLKDEERYEHTLAYYTEGVSAHLVIWLVRNAWVAERIAAALKSTWRREEALAFLDRTAFIGLDDFKARVWETECFTGRLKGLSIRKLHANLWQNIGKTQEKCRQNDLRAVFFPKYKSPQKFVGYKQRVPAEVSQHPSGPGGTLSNNLSTQATGLEPAAQVPTPPQATPCNGGLKYES